VKLTSGLPKTDGFVGGEGDDFVVLVFGEIVVALDED